MKNKILVNQLGYLTTGYKTAVYAASSGDSFSVCSAESNKTVFKGHMSEVMYDPIAGENVRRLDFSELTDEGIYYLKIGTRRSPKFEICGEPYRDLKNALLKSFYFNRCGEELTEEFAGEYARRKCHSQPASLYENETVKLDVSGGWHDSGAYGKYVVSACTALAHLLNAYRLFPDSFKDKVNIPESGSDIPDILCECRHELEWLLKMQAKDGGVYHKVCAAKENSGFVMPDADTEKQFVFPKSHGAAAAFSACTALASGIYAEFDGEFAEKLKNAAFSAWVWLANHPKFEKFVNPHGVEGGEYSDDNFTDDLVWAACELYAVTGDEGFAEIISDNYGETKLAGFDWLNVAGFGSLTYLICDRPKDTLVLNTMAGRFKFIGDYFSSMAGSNGFGVAKDNNRFLWGSNMTVLCYCMTLACSYILHGNEDYLRTASSHFDYILGKNPLGVCYITGITENSCRHPHHYQSAADDVDDPVPGLVCGGPDMLRSDDYAKWHIPKGTAPAKCYVDNEFSYSTNDTTIYWCSPAVFASAFFEELGRDPQLKRVREMLGGQSK